MKTIEIQTPDGKTLELSAPDNASPDDIHGAVQQAVAHYSQSMGPKPGVADAAAQASDPMTMIKSAAPSKVLSTAGVMAANAPGITSALVNSLPGIGTPSAIPQAVANIAQNPSQMQQAASRAVQTAGGAEMTPDEQTQSNMGQVAGTAMEMSGPGLNEGVKATGPFTAGLRAPETAATGAFEEAGQQLGKAKTAASGGGLDPAQTTQIKRFRDAFARKSDAQVGKLASEGMDAVEAGKDLTPMQIIGYRAAMGKAQSNGGPFANEFAKGVKVLDAQLAQKAPQLADAMKKMALQFAAKDGEEFKLPALTLAVDHGVGLAKTAINASKTAGVRNLAGAAVGAATPALPALTDIMNQAYDKVFNRKKKGE